MTGILVLITALIFLAIGLWIGKDFPLIQKKIEKKELDEKEIKEKKELEEKEKLFKKQWEDLFTYDGSKKK